MKIEILGTGCYKCIQMENMINELLLELGNRKDVVQRVSNEKEIRHYMPVDEIPGLVIDGVLCSTLEIPSRETLRAWLSR